MKIEVGESLMRSWLRHVEKCQVAELNWKPSQLWPLYSQSAESLMKHAKEYFANAGGIDPFGGTASASQLIKQGEIDVLGIRISGQAKIEAVYAVDIAFHEGGLNYSGKSSDTKTRIVKKMIRSAIIARAYFGAVPLRLVFASPVVQPSRLAELEATFQSIQNFLSTHENDVACDFLVNEHFSESVIRATCTAGSSVADTSELFLRSYLLFENSLVVAGPPVASRRVEILQGPENGGSTLQIELEPSSESVFKESLLRTQKAVFTIFYNDGRIVERSWDASKFSSSSNLMGNIRSRPEFRQGQWQKLGIRSVKVKCGSQNTR